MKKSVSLFISIIFLSIVLAGCGTTSLTSGTQPVITQSAATTSLSETTSTTATALTTTIPTSIITQITQTTGASAASTTTTPLAIITTPASTSTSTVTTSAATVTPVTTVPGQTVGLFINTPQAYVGYTLIAPKQSFDTYLINNLGQVVHSWTASKYPPGQSAYLLPNGNLIRACSLKNPDINTGGGEGGRIEEYDWNDNLVWSLDYSTDQYMQHHDFCVLPDGDILMLVVEKKTYAQAVAAGFNPSLIQAVQTQGYILPDSIVEIQPTYPSGGTVVWSWHVWDHLIQNYSSSEANYGNPALHPELIDPNGGGNQIPVFWNHMNSITYNATLDQIMVSVRGNSEIWIIDHSTTTVQAAGHAGGKYGKGGDLLYRWGDPSQYGTGTQTGETLFQQHDAMWIDAGLPGAGDILVFNNGEGRNYTSVDEFTPPVDANGNYTLTAGKAYGPTGANWTYSASPPASFYCPDIGGAQRLPNGDTLICDGINGTLFEVTTDGQIVWEYVNPVINTGPLSSTAVIPPDPTHAGQYLNEIFRVTRYAPDYAGLAGKDLAATGTLVK